LSRTSPSFRRSPIHRSEVLHVTEDEVGNPVSIRVHRITGGQAGPTIGLFGTQHGDEWFCVAEFNAVLDAIRNLVFAGQVILVPVCSPAALARGVRVTQTEADVPDLNRTWPGGNTWLSGQIAKRLADGPVAECDAVLDLHTGCWGVAWHAAQYGGDIADAGIVERSRALAFASGLNCVQRGRVIREFPGPASLTGYVSAVLGRPAASLWIGGGGFGAAAEEHWLTLAQQALLNAMALLGMTGREPVLPERMLHFERDIRINPLRGGLLRPARDPDELLREVRVGEELGQVLDMQTLEVGETLVAPESGSLLYMSRSRPLGPGDWGFGIAAAESSEWIDPRARLGHVTPA
jgi:hypothetical protein